LIKVRSVTADGSWWQAAWLAGLIGKGAQRFVFLPTQLVIVMDLTMTARWSELERACARNGAIFGPLSLINTQLV
jgi:hypothetical protein